MSLCGISALLKHLGRPNSIQLWTRRVENGIKTTIEDKVNPLKLSSMPQQIP